ncbi:MAG: FHA domain-containing protein [Desulfobacterales bacterium]|jgi:pSer/pThr/pTyr-binding forkhead associated (FHA) protein
MPILSLKFKGNTIQDYTLSPERSITIGRSEDNLITIENLAVSNHHAKIDSVGNGFLLTDLQSKNGCFVNEKMVSTHWLQDGDVVHIGKHTLCFSYGPEESPPPHSPTHSENTMVMDAGQYRDMLEKDDSVMAERLKSEKEPVGILSYLTGGDGEVVLSKKIIKIGKDKGSDIRITGFAVGQTAATISRRPSGYYLSYVGGLFKPKVNGATVKESIPLNEFDIIELGSTKLQFFTKE